MPIAVKDVAVAPLARYAARYAVEEVRAKAASLIVCPNIVGNPRAAVFYVANLIY